MSKSRRVGLTAVLSPCFPTDQREIQAFGANRRRTGTGILGAPAISTDRLTRLCIDGPRETSRLGDDPSGDVADNEAADRAREGP